MGSQGSFTVGQRLRYRFDNLFAKGVLPVMLAMSVALLLLFVVAGAVQTLFSWGPEDKPVPFLEAFWISLTRSLDPGTFGNDQGNHFRFIGLLVTLAGLVALASMIGLISSAIDRRLAILRAGRSLVVEEGHTLILGWSTKVPYIIAELVEANASERDAAVVLLSPASVDQVEQRVRALVPDLRTVRLVIRTGDPTSLLDLERVNPAAAKSVITVVGDEMASDSQVVKTVLGVVRVTGPEGPPIVVELRRREVADALKLATGERTAVLVSSEIVAKIAAQVTRSSGLGVVYQQLLEFTGDEIYLTPAVSLAGCSFGASLLSYPAASVIGLAHLDGSVRLNPPMDAVVAPDDQLIVIAEDDSVIGESNGPSQWVGDAHANHHRDPPRVETTLIVGWSQSVPLIAKEIDDAVAPGSRLDVMFDPVLAPDVSVASLTTSNQKVRLIPADALDLTRLGELLEETTYDHVLIACYRDALDPVEADASALLVLMAARHHRGARSTNVVTELLQSEDMALAEVARPDDVVVSERLMSLAMAQISENRRLATVFRTLLDADDVSVALRPWSDYLSDGAADYTQVIETARGRGEVAIGWRCAALEGHPKDLGFGIFINPPKDLQASFSGDDRVIVLA